MCLAPPYDTQQARQRPTADLRMPHLFREDVLCRKRPEIPPPELTHGRVERLLGLMTAGSAKFGLTPGRADCHQCQGGHRS
jgi:hypothetical protein